jgi:hypothetical protein
MAAEAIGKQAPGCRTAARNGNKAQKRENAFKTVTFVWAIAPR